MIHRRLILRLAFLAIPVLDSARAACATTFPDELIVSGQRQHCIQIESGRDEAFAVMSVMLLDAEKRVKACILRGYYSDGDKGNGVVSTEQYVAKREKATAGAGTIYIQRETGVQYDFIPKKVIFGENNPFCLQGRYPQYKNFSNDLFEDKSCVGAKIQLGRIYLLQIYFYKQGDINKEHLVVRDKIRVASVFFKLDAKGQARRVQPPASAR